MHNLECYFISSDISVFTINNTVLVIHIRVYCKFGGYTRTVNLKSIRYNSDKHVGSRKVSTAVAAA